jgi:hypothetical protein
MEQNNEVVEGNEFESTHNGNTYTVQRIEGNRVQLSSPETGASWHTVSKVEKDIADGVLN